MDVTRLHLTLPKDTRVPDVLARTGVGFGLEPAPITTIVGAVALFATGIDPNVSLGFGTWVQLTAKLAGPGANSIVAWKRTA